MLLTINHRIDVAGTVGQVLEVELQLPIAVCMWTARSSV